jgi:dTDP-glucose 4,6-dehydratase
MRLLVTGGAGFIGSNFIRYWLKKYKEDKITNLDRLTYAGHLTSTQDYSSNSNYTFVKGDICDRKIVDKLMKDIDYVIHFAAESHVDRSLLDPSVFIKTNVLGTQILLDSALTNKIKKFHYVSTDEVFGSLPLNTKAKFNENTVYDPSSPYSASKASSDHLVRSYFRTFGLPVTITNCSNNFGPYQDPEKFLPRMITNLILSKPIYIYGDGLNIRDWLYVDDHCRAIDLVLKKGKVGETYLVGGMNKDFNNLQIAKMVLKIFKKNESDIEFVKDRPGHDRRYSVDWKKINSQLKWKPKFDFEVWLGKTVDWYVNNEWWWKSIKNKSELIYKTK